MYTLTDIVRTRLRWLNLPRKMPQALDRDAFEILPRSAQRRRPRSRMPSVDARSRASASYALHRWRPTHPGVSDRQASAGRCPSRASLHPGQLPGCCRTGQQGRQRARVLILLASHFPIVRRIYDSIPNLMGVVKFGLVAAVRPGEIPTLRARTPRALQRRESPLPTGRGTDPPLTKSRGSPEGRAGFGQTPGCRGLDSVVRHRAVLLCCRPGGLPQSVASGRREPPVRPHPSDSRMETRRVTIDWYGPCLGLVSSTGYPGATPDLSLTSFILAQIESKAVDRAMDAPVAGRAHESPALSTSGHRWIAVGAKEGAINRER